MIKKPRYAHTNLIARDWRALAEFYQSVFGCVPVPPERNCAASELEAGTGVPGASVEGIHLRLPGYGEKGPTLEIFTYSLQEEPPILVVNRPGYGQGAFSVQSVPEAREEVLSSGGKPIGG